MWLMETDKNWIRFIKSGKIADYLNFVNSCKENELSGGYGNTVYNRGACNKRNEGWGE